MNEAVAAASDPRSELARDAAIAKKLVGYARKRTRDSTRALDLAQEAIARALDGKGFCRWDPSSKKLLDHLSDIVDSVVGNENTRAARRREVAPDSQRDANKRDSDANLEVRALREEEEARRQRLADRVMERVADDPIIPRMLAREQDGAEGAAELAQALGCRDTEIYRARERLAYHRDIVLDAARKRGELP
jgi:DNA-directed RNA polymerase specialized sigma24 family protein